MNNNQLINISYTEGPDGLLYPDIDLGITEPVGKYGRLWKELLSTNYPQRVSELLLSGDFHRLMRKVDKELEELHEDIILVLSQKYPLPNTENLLKRAAHMQLHYNMTEEYIISLVESYL